MLGFSLVAGGAFARLLGGLLTKGWRTQLVYWLLLLMVLTRLFYTLELATPLFRFYFLVAALLSLVFCLRWSTKKSSGEDAPRFPWLFVVAAVFLTGIVLSEALGEPERAEYLFLATHQQHSHSDCLWSLALSHTGRLGLGHAQPVPAKHSLDTQKCGWPRETGGAVGQGTLGSPCLGCLAEISGSSMTALPVPSRGCSPGG